MPTTCGRWGESEDRGQGTGDAKAHFFVFSVFFVVPLSFILRAFTPPMREVKLAARVGERGASASEHGKCRRSPNWHGTAKRGNVG